MPYNPEEDDLYENAIFVDELLKARDYIGQAFEVMNNAAQWGVPVLFDGHGIETGSRKGLHTYWPVHVEPKAAIDATYSDIANIQVRSVQKSLRNCLLFAMRMNLHSRRVCNDQGLRTGYFDEDGNFVDGDPQDPNSKYLREIGWIINPIEFVAKNFGNWLNDIKNNVTMGPDTNWGDVTRGSQGRLFEIINSTAFNYMALRPEINDIDVYDPQIGSQKPLINPKLFLEV
jgi:hypothetical protein